MPSRDRTCLLVHTPSGTTINVQTSTPADAEALAEALHEAQPSWRVRIGGRQAVFSREGKIVDFIESLARPVEAGRAA